MTLCGLAALCNHGAQAYSGCVADLVAREHGTCTTAYRLKGALEARRPPIQVSEALLKVWFAKYRLPDGALTVSSADELQEKYGSILPDLAASHPSAYRLGPVARVLRVSFSRSDSGIRMIPKQKRYILESRF